MKTSNARDLRPMLAALEDAPLQDDQLVYEPKYDGIRALVEIDPGRGSAGVHIWSRLGNEKTAQFPEIVRELVQFGRKLRAPVILDGEIVALDEHGAPAGFQKLQGRIHLSDVREHIPRGASNTAFVAFDILRDGSHDLCVLPLADRRARLERMLATTGSDLIRISEFVVGDGRALYRMAQSQGWEGLIAKRLHSQYKPGRRTSDWRKLKIVHQQEFVVGGWTEPRASRQYFGALLLGVYQNREPGTRTQNDDDHVLRYVGHTGSGFSDAELARVWKLMKPLEITTCPFDSPPPGNERPHWVRPSLVAEVKFSEWTDDDKLRHPIYLGLRDDKKPEQVVREPIRGEAAASSEGRHAARDRPRVVRPTAVHHSRVETPPSRAGGRRTRKTDPSHATAQDLVNQLDEIQARGGDGLLRLPDEDTLRVTNLKKVFWPALRLTKGDLFRFYARVSPYLLPVVADRPLVMKRFPNGVKGKAFYQQRAPDDVPPGVRVEVLEDDHDVPNRLVGGSLKTLLYMTQMAAISQDPWFSRVQSPRMADHVALDLDPMPGVTFNQVLDVARWVHDELRELRVEGYAKTSGSDGLHVFIPLPRNTPYEAGQIFCQIIATMVARKHPKQATVERTVSARGQKVYVDYLQNIHGKTLACAYSARASDFAGASTPLTWNEVHKGIAREDLTIVTLPDRLDRIGDLWAPLLVSKGANLRAVEKYLAAER